MGLSALSTLDLSDNDIGDISPLADGGGLQALASLDLGQKAIHLTQKNSVSRNVVNGGAGLGHVETLRVLLRGKDARLPKGASVRNRVSRNRGYPVKHGVRIFF